MPKKRAKKRPGKVKKATIQRRVRQSKIDRIKETIKRKPSFRDESLAPTVDHPLLLALVRRELPEGSRRALYRLIHSFKSWNDAYTDALLCDIGSTKRPLV